VFSLSDPRVSINVLNTACIVNAPPIKKSANPVAELSKKTKNNNKGMIDAVMLRQKSAVKSCRREYRKVRTDTEKTVQQRLRKKGRLISQTKGGLREQGADAESRPTLRVVNAL
jgi:hypothetical protein